MNHGRLNHPYMTLIQNMYVFESGAEYVLRWLPIGTHDWNKFLKPEEIKSKITKLNLSIKDVKGLVFNPLTKKWKTSDDVSVNYVMVATKN